MFDKLIDAIYSFAELFRVGVIINQYEQAVCLTFGVMRREVLKPGFHWLIPLGIDQVLKDNVVTATHNLATQKLTTSDSVPVIIGLMLRWRINDIAKVLLECEGADQVIADSAYGECSKLVRCSTWEQLNSEQFRDALYKTIRKRAFRFGIEVEELQLTDLARMKVLCLVGGDQATSNAWKWGAAS